jgi:hypothetical protein
MGFRYAGATPLTPEEYSSSFVNYYNQFLGLPSLKDDTDVGVDDPENITELRRPGEETSGGDRDDIFSGAGTPSDVRGLEVKTGLGSFAGNTYGSYKESLKAAGLTDRVSFVENIVDPILDGDISGIKFGKQVGAITDESVKGIKGIKQAIDDPSSVVAKVKEKIPSAAAKALTMVNPAFGAGVGGILTGRSFKNAFGQTSFRPGGALGFVSDVVSAKQFDDINKISLAGDGSGFAGTIGGMGITRAPGSGTYTGSIKAAGLSHAQVKAIEAISKGYLPSSFNMNDETGTSFEEAGYTGLSTGGAYGPKGTFMDRFGNTSRYGSMKDLKDLADDYYDGSVEAARTALENARSGREDLDKNVNRQKEAQRNIDKRQRELSDKPSDIKSGGDSSSGGDSGMSEEDRERGPTDPFGGGGERGDGFRAMGGRVGLQMGGTAGRMSGQSGFVERPPSQVPEGETVADDVETALPEGAFVINAAAVEFAGEEDIKKMLLDANKEAVRRGLTVDKQGNNAKLVDVAISRGEVVVSPHIAKIIGYDRLEKINNRGKRETKERIQENGQEQPGAAEGGFLMPEPRPFEGGFLTPKPRPFRLQPEALADVEFRADLEEYIQNDPLARLGFNLYEKGDLDVKAVVVPDTVTDRAARGRSILMKSDGRLRVGGVYTPVKYRETSGGPVAKEFESLVEQQQGPDKQNREVAGVHYFAGQGKNFDRHMGNLVLLHELRHHAMRYIQKEYDIPVPRDYRDEEHMMDIQDNMNRVDARKVKPSIPEKSKSAEHQIRKENVAQTYPNLERKLAAYQKAALQSLKDRKVPKRVESKQVEGFLDKAMNFLGLN